ncbi:hypothetical protein [Synechococcus sp. CBW1107]|uniref:hypothetical protein n=1 Tax=Synechococcus sp. CBW1107 TaxID=2789857 RepID=UPI002AD31289|nr:hypothetical protein [Synechococcus sp. CBW1107]
MFFAVPPMEPILSPQDSSARSQAHPCPSACRASFGLQLAATIEAWEAECACGWLEPAPVDRQGELSLPSVNEPALIGSCWDSWSSHPYLEQQQVEELPGFDACGHY